VVGGLAVAARARTRPAARGSVPPARPLPAGPRPGLSLDTTVHLWLVPGSAHETPSAQ
jgi:hypothetical protein